MSSTTLHGLFDIQRSEAVPAPAAVLSKQAPRAHELDELSFGARYNGPTQEARAKSTPSDLEMSRPSSPVNRQSVPQMQAWNKPSINKWRILCCCLIYLSNGMNDSVVGAILPYVETYYRIGYATVSTIFVGNAVGFIVAAFLTNWILQRLGRVKTMMCSDAVMVVGYAIVVATPPFPVVVIAFFILGCGMAVNLALNNVFCANLHPSSAVLGAAHGSYGLGGIIAPILGTAMVTKGILWSRFYLIELGLRFCCIAFSAWAFWNYEEEPHLGASSSDTVAANDRDAVPVRQAQTKTLAAALMNRITIVGAVFIFAYQGAEVAISGWDISFLISYRDGNPGKVGYVTAGFWGGITLGRFVLTHLAPRIGEKNFVAGLTAGCLLFQLLAWHVPSIVGNAVAVSILGLLLGPVYPCAQTIFSRLLPRNMQTTAIGFIAGAGSSGGAVAPFTTGILAQAVGTWVLHPVCIGLFVAMLACWVGLPRMRKRTE